MFIGVKHNFSYKDRYIFNYIGKTGELVWSMKNNIKIIDKTIALE